jgi:toxin ParE1/3/4
MSEIRVSRQAEADLQEIWLYLAQRNEQAADRLIASVSQQFETLAAFPGLGQRSEDLAQGLRGSPVGRYVIFYRPFEGGIEVFRVVHGARDIKSLFDPGSG